MSTEHIASTTTARFVNTIRFYDLFLPVQAVNTLDYLPLKPLNDFIGMDWRTTKDTIQSGDNAKLFEPLWLPPVCIAVGGGLMPPSKAVLHIRLDRAHMYLARINTDRVRVNGNVHAADFLLALQLEWAKALHAYETHGIAVKAGRRNTLRELAQSARAIEQIRDTRTRHLLAAALHNELAAMGLPAERLEESKQAELPLSAAHSHCEQTP